MSAYKVINCLISQPKICFFGTPKDRLNEKVLLSTKGSLTLAMGKCLWFSVKIKV